MPQNSTLDLQITKFGKQIFSAIGQTKPSVFSKNFLHSRIMEWSLQYPEFKNSLFRLVDVLPSLKSAKAISRHIDEYLSEPAKQISKSFQLGFKTLKLGTLPAFFGSLAVKQSVNQMASVFIAGEKAADANKALKELLNNGISFTVDLLGEYSVSTEESLAYLDRYIEAIREISRASKSWKPKWQIQNHQGTKIMSNVSVKLTAMYSQCSPLNFDKSVDVLSKRLAKIITTAKENKVQIYIDAEDTTNNPIIYAVFKKVFGSQEFADFELPGIVLQAYAKNSEGQLLDLINFAKSINKKIAIRLVKGAYWDHETASSAANEWENPLFTEKVKTDHNYEKLSKILLHNLDYVYPAFGSHNIRSLSHACCYAKQKNIPNTAFELQMLYGMALPIAKAFTAEGYLVRMYTPVGELIPGMGYLVRRLLENTSNDSFLRHTFYDTKEIDTLLESPAERLNLPKPKFTL